MRGEESERTRAGGTAYEYIYIYIYVALDIYLRLGGVRRVCVRCAPLIKSLLVLTLSHNVPTIDLQRSYKCLPALIGDEPIIRSSSNSTVRLYLRNTYSISHSNIATIMDKCLLSPTCSDG